ncbi:DUF1801 domain-containing protein [Georgenia sp. 10Sc9-8]|uniref:DUF1801 domain-containing protein n=1 Tax=Georgenia halotolerans TaxID=3028317 RepID=A0ABT5TZW3_9MICO|nr:DUF1801 domain-containing protein [Georgenia halotolerans]
MDRLPADVASYLDDAPAERRELLHEVFSTIRSAVPEGYELAMAFGMPCWSVPLSRHPDTYNGQPLGYVAVAGQKNYVSVYLLGLCSRPEVEQQFRDRWRASTGRIDMGRSCLRLKKRGDLDAELLAETVAGTPVEEFLHIYERSRTR